MKLHGGPAVRSRLAECDDLGTAPVRDAGTQVADAAAAVHAEQVQLLNGEAKARFQISFDENTSPLAPLPPPTQNRPAKHRPRE